MATLFVAVSRYDEIFMRPSQRLTVTVDGQTRHGVPSDDANLGAKAILAFAEQYRVAPNVHLHIRKNLPVQGGMGGGSADAAAALYACNAYWDTQAKMLQLRELAESLGSDVPFALTGGAALGFNKGEQLSVVSSSRMTYFAFAVASEGLSTMHVFDELENQRSRSPNNRPLTQVSLPPVPIETVKSFSRGDATALAPLISNDLQQYALALQPTLEKTLISGLEGGALAAFITGSGATCAFLARDRYHAAVVATHLRASGTCRAAFTAHGPVSGPTVTN